MDVGLKIWRYNRETGERELREYEVDAPEEATLLDCLDIVKDRVDGTLAYRKSCRMMICGSCGMRMDGAAVLACKARMNDIVEAGHVPVISAMGNLPIVKDLVVDMAPFWEKFRSVKPYLAARLRRAAGRPGAPDPQERMNVIHKEALCINCGCCVSECNSMESDPLFTARRRSRRRSGSSATRATARKVERLEELNGEHGIWDCTRCYMCNERCPKGVDPRDAIAKLGAESMSEGIDRDMGAKHAKWFVTRRRRRAGCARRSSSRRRRAIVSAIKQTRFAIGLAKKGKVPPPVPPHVAKDVEEARRLLRPRRGRRGVDGYRGIVQGERALARLAHGTATTRDPYGEARSRAVPPRTSAGASDAAAERMGSRRRPTTRSRAQADGGA